MDSPNETPNESIPVAPKKTKSRVHRALNLLLFVFVAGQIGVIYWMNSGNSDINVVLSKVGLVATTAPVIPEEQRPEAKLHMADSTTAVEAPKVAVVSKEEVAPSNALPSSDELMNQDATVDEVQKPSEKIAKAPVKKASSHKQKQVDLQDSQTVDTSDPWSTAGLEDKVSASDEERSGHPVGKASREEKALVDAFSFQEDDVNDGSEAPTLVQSLHLSSKKASILATKYRRLMSQLREADKKGANGTRRMLIDDHMAWAKEFLGAEKFGLYVQSTSALKITSLSK